jgi:uncharacterized RDD family membrane protein YckC
LVSTENYGEKEKHMSQAVPVTLSATTMDVHVTGRRILAIIVDGIIVALPTGLMGALLGVVSAGGGEVSASLEGVAGLFVALTSVVLYFGYYVLMEGYLGQTLGKMLIGIKVVREADGGVPGVKAAAIRTVLRIVDGLFSYLVGFIAVLASAKNQRLGDMAAHTLVVRK